MRLQDLLPGRLRRARADPVGETACGADALLEDPLAPAELPFQLAAPDLDLSPTPTEGHTAAGAQARCPYCHDAIDLAAQAWSCCALCLARHHRDCWREHAVCASCGHDQGLTALPRGESSLWREATRPHSRLRAAGTVLACSLPFLMAPLMIVWAQVTRAGPAWTSQIRTFETALVQAKHARQAYRDFLLNRNSGSAHAPPEQARAYRERLRRDLDLAEEALLGGIAAWERSLAPYRDAAGQVPENLQPYQESLDNLRHYLDQVRSERRAHLGASESAPSGGA